MFDGKKMAAIRKSRNMTMMDVAVGMADNNHKPFQVAAVNLLEKGGTKEPQASTLERICKALDCTIYDLLSDDFVEAQIEKLREFASHYKRKRSR